MEAWVQPQQTISSAQTCRIQLPAVCKLVGDWTPGTINADIGGGSGDRMTFWLAERGVENIVWDPFNRSEIHNQQSRCRLEGGQADTATLSNVLNVIPEEAAVQQVLLTTRDALKVGGQLYITVYYDKSLPSFRETKHGWQRNEPLRSYIPQIVAAGFTVVECRRKLLVVKK